MATDLQQEASRTNGAKSQGPVTEEGKARSAQNATKHGLNSRVVVLANESQELFDQLHEAYRQEWSPRGQTENDLVFEIAAAQWRLRRIKAIETATIDTEMFIQKPEFDRCFTNKTATMRQADAFMSMALNNPASLDQMNRYETRYSRLYSRSVETLVKLLRQRGENPVERKEAAEKPAPVQNEPGDLWTQIVQGILAIILWIRGLLTRPQQARRTSAPTRNLGAASAPETRETAPDPEILNWETAFLPTEGRPTTKQTDWTYKPA